MVVETWEWWCEPKWMMKIEKWRENASDLSSPFSFSFFLSFLLSLSLFLVIRFLFSSLVLERFSFYSSSSASAATAGFPLH